ncbi:MAG TPA: c-type cytochrome [Daejeonella sp.]
MKQLFILGMCALFLACGDSSNERGIASTSADSTASGSAYNSNDGFAPAAPSAAPPATAAAAAPASAPADTVVTTTTAPANPAAAATTTKAPAAAPAKPAASANDDAEIKRGEALIAKSDCFACHKVDVKVLGPSYKDVANKYPNNASTVNQLVEKIKKGGSGVWGAIPMSPHPALSDDDAKAMVKYVLSLK